MIKFASSCPVATLVRSDDDEYDILTAAQCVLVMVEVIVGKAMTFSGTRDHFLQSRSFGFVPDRTIVE